MRLLMIASGYPPYLFSENLCNGKLVMALMKAGIEVDVISKVDEGPSYGTEWTHPWDMLKPTAHIIEYPLGNKIHRTLDVLYSGATMGWNFTPGVRWMRRAYRKALQMMSQNHYDAVLTRSPNDIAHYVGEKLKRKTGVKWIANWNDPATPIWPEPYTHRLSERKQQKEMHLTAKLLKGADINTFPSDSLRQHFIGHFPFLKDSKTEVIPHIGLVEEFWPKVVVTEKYGKLRLLHSGNLSAERNPETTFQAFRRLIDEGKSNFEFHIMGHINDYTTQLIEKYNLQDYVKCIGSYPYMDALAMMQGYDVLVLLEAKLKKGIFFASKFTDYLQTGLPILAISPKEGFAADMLSGKEGEYFAHNEDTASIYSALDLIISKYNASSLNLSDSRSLYKEVSPQKVVEKMHKLCEEK